MVRNGRKRKLSGLGIGIISVLVVGLIVGGGYFVYDSFLTKYPKELTTIDNATKSFGKVKSYKQMTDTAFIVQYYPETAHAPLNKWAVEETDAMREQVVKHQFSKVLPKDSKRHTLKQDYTSKAIDNRFASVSLTTIVDGKETQSISRVFDIKNNKFLDTHSVFKPKALRSLTHLARQAIAQGDADRIDYLNATDLTQPQDSLSLDGYMLTFNTKYGSYTMDVSKYTDYLAEDFGNIAATNGKIPSAYISTPIDPNKKLVALTFDDGPHGELTEQVLDILKQYDAKATFFMLGSRIEGREDLVREVMDGGHQVANHSFNHPNLTHLQKPDAISQITDTEKRLENATGYAGPYYVRPPYGAINETLRKDIGRVFMNWSVDTEDWLSKDPVKICEKIQKETFDGAVVLMHDIHPTTIEGFKCAIQKLSDEGYTFVTVEDLFASRGYDLDAGSLHRLARKK